MESNELTGIERELVLQYLIDGNVPVTVTPVEDSLQNPLPFSDSAGTNTISIENSAQDNATPALDSNAPPDSNEIKPASTSVFPIAIKAEQLTVLDKGIILLTNPPQAVVDFKTSKVKVEFYFNRLGLYFITDLKKVSAGLALVIPSSIKRITEIPRARPTDFSCVLYYSVQQKSDVHINCFPCEGYKLFEKPVWADIKEEEQQKAKSYLETFIVHARKAGTSGNGVQLIPVCRYLSEMVATSHIVHAMQGRADPLDILFADYERIVFASRTENMHLKQGAEYALEMQFPLPKPLGNRKIFATCFVEDNYCDDEKLFTCAVCRFTSLQEEDLRFLYEKCTKKIFE